MNKTDVTILDRKKLNAARGGLFATAILWGSGFLPQKIAANTLSPFLFNGGRYLLGALIVLALTKGKLPFGSANRKNAILAGSVLLLAAIFQQIGLRYTSVGNCSFITTTYVIMVPFFSWLFFRKSLRKASFIAAGFALVGLYLLSVGGKPLDHISKGDLLSLVGAVFWALHIIIVGNAAENGDPLQFSAGQFLVCAVWNLLIWLLWEGGNVSGLSAGWLAIPLSGVFVIGGGFTLQAVAQKYADASEAAIILSLESVFGAMFGAMFLSEALSSIQLLGAGLIFIGVLIAVRD